MSTRRRRVRLLVVVLLGLGALLPAACSQPDQDEGTEARPASEAGEQVEATPEQDEAFCAVVEEQREVATGDDLLAAYPAVEAMADAAPPDLEDVFEENLVALEPAARADDADEAREVFVEEVAPNEAYTDSLGEIVDAVDERCDVDLGTTGS